MEKSKDQNQFAYKKARSTVDAVGLLAHTIAKSLDGGTKVQKAVFMDFSSDFNTISRSQTFDRLSSLGAPSWIVRWLLSYFTNRRQRVRLTSYRALDLENDIVAGSHIEGSTV